MNSSPGWGLPNVLGCAKSRLERNLHAAFDFVVHQPAQLTPRASTRAPSGFVPSRRCSAFALGALFFTPPVGITGAEITPERESFAAALMH